MGVYFFKCDDCHNVVNDHQYYVNCTGCDRSFCGDCAEELEFEYSDEGEVVSCDYCRTQESFKKIIDKYDQLIYDKDDNKVTVKFGTGYTQFTLTNLILFEETDEELEITLEHPGGYVTDIVLKL